MNYTVQIKRIKTKLVIAKETDKDFKVFGSTSHKYNVENPINSNQIELFETKYNITLPECYKSFITHMGSGAGPFYGIWDLDKGINRLLYNAEKYLSIENRCMSYSYEEWGKLEEDDSSDEEYEILYNELFAGILPIGTTGCSGIIGLLLVGKDKGKIVHLSDELYFPFMTFEDNFLDWYERWLDEIISGKLIKNGGSNFASIMGGGETKLFDKLKSANTDNEKIKILLGIFELNSILEKNIQNIEILISNKNQIIKKNALLILTKFYHSLATSTLNNMIQGNNEDEILMALEALSNIPNMICIDMKYLENLVFHSEYMIKKLALQLMVRFNYEVGKKCMLNILDTTNTKDCQIVCDTINLYAKDKINYWAKPLINRLIKDDNKEELIWSIMYIVAKSDYNYLDELSPLCFDKNIKVREYAYCFLGKLNDKSSLESIF
jgi:hypothetical protein